MRKMSEKNMRTTIGGAAGCCRLCGKFFWTDFTRGWHGITAHWGYWSAF